MEHPEQPLEQTQPTANTSDSGPNGDGSGDDYGADKIKVLEGLEAKTGGRTKIHYEKGCDVEGGPAAGTGVVVAAARAS